MIGIAAEGESETANRLWKCQRLQVVSVSYRTRGRDMGGNGGWDDITFEGEHEVVQRVLVLPVCFRIVLLDIFVDGSLHNFDSALSRTRVPSSQS